MQMENFILGLLLGFALAVLGILSLFYWALLRSRAKENPTKDEWRMR